MINAHKKTPKGTATTKPRMPDAALIVKTLEGSASFRANEPCSDGNGLGIGAAVLEDGINSAVH